MSKKQQLPESTEDVAELRALLEAKEARIAALELLVDKFRTIAYGPKSEKRSRVDIPEELLAQGYLFHAELVAEADRMAR